MGNLSLLLVGLIALGMTACSNEDEIKVEGQPESTVSIRVTPASNGPVVRATGDLTTAGNDGVLAAESAIKTLEVYLFNGDTPDGYGKVTGTGVTEVTGIATHSGTKDMVVVANANIGAVGSKTALLAKTKDLPVDIGNGLVMSAEPVAIELIEGENQYGYAGGNLSTTALSLYRVNARVAIVAADLGELPAGQAALFDALTDVQVAMFNVPETTKLFDPLVTNGNFLYGQAWPSGGSTFTADAIESTFVEATITWPITNAAAPYFYVNENTSETSAKQMMIVVRAKPMLGEAAVTAEGVYTDANGYTYYPIWVNATKDGYTYTGENTGTSNITRNTQYNISLTIKGLGNPTIDPPVRANLDVMVEVAPWLVVDQTVEWN